MGGKLLRFLKSHNVAFSASGKGLKIIIFHKNNLNNNKRIRVK